jgi:hypothetical protein
VFAHKHALAQAHACGGSKCKGRIPSPKGAGGGLHKRSAEDEGAPCARERQSLLAGLVFLPGAERRDCVCLGFQGRRCGQEQACSASRPEDRSGWRRGRNVQDERGREVLMGSWKRRLNCSFRALVCHCLFANEQLGMIVLDIAQVAGNRSGMHLGSSERLQQVDGRRSFVA